ncbi:MAG: hypothetical protein A2Z88_00530 [Omnitrophica WOR_2 bacterium GWA2_47_8]|nr:MAG: hypothetical protein A2Z88_00530 [Omnitrophica WOR_2 bacterium GWA2_47_8]
MKRIILAVVFGLFLTLGQNSFISADTTTMGQAVQEQTVGGNVANVSADVITLNPKGGLFFGQIMLEINPETQFESISSAGELEKGDQIKAEYVEKDGKKVASRIMKIAGTAQEGKT